MIDMQTSNATRKLLRLMNAPTIFYDIKIARNFVYWNIRILIGNTITMVVLEPEGAFNLAFNYWS